MAYLRAIDTISGQEGKATAVISGVVTELFQIKSLEASMEKNKTEVKTLGKRGVQNKTSGWKGKGSMTMYYVTSAFRQLALAYNKTGIDVNFDITVENTDPTSSVGTQTIVLYNCNIDTTVLAKLDTQAEVLEEDCDFTFDDFDVTSSFDKPVAL